jgi:hypothetical protein
MAPRNELQREIADCLDEALRLQSRVIIAPQRCAPGKATHDGIGAGAFSAMTKPPSFAVTSTLTSGTRDFQGPVTLSAVKGTRR